MESDQLWMDYRLVLSNLKCVDLWFLVTVNIDVSCYMNLGFFSRCGTRARDAIWIIHDRFQMWTTQFSRLCRIMTYLLPIIKKQFKKHFFEKKLIMRVLTSNQVQLCYWRNMRNKFVLRQLRKNTEKLSCMTLSLKNLRFAVYKKHGHANCIDICSIFCFFHEGFFEAITRIGEWSIILYQGRFRILILKTQWSCKR